MGFNFYTIRGYYKTNNLKEINIKNDTYCFFDETNVDDIDSKT